MPRTLAQRRLSRLWKRGIGLPGDNNTVLEAARKLTAQTAAPVLGVPSRESSGAFLVSVMREIV